MASAVSSEIDVPETKPQRSQRRSIIALLFTATLVLVIFFLLPLAWLFRMSLNYGDYGGVIVSDVTLANYRDFLTDDFHLTQLWTTVRLGLIVSFATLLVAYPIALFIARSRSRWKGLLTALAIAPLLTSSVVRTYGWMVILGNQGFVNGSLMSTGLIDRPLRLINNETGVIVGMVEILMPFMILGLLSGFGRFNPDIEQAAASLGASPIKTFFRITLPLSIPGIATGCLLVFVLTISSFVTPRLLGGGRVFLMATEIYDQATYNLNWPFASAISFLLLLMFSAVIIVYLRIVRRIEQS
jgi:putative spermidine/putrescine transport system permease protein